MDWKSNHVSTLFKKKASYYEAFFLFSQLIADKSYNIDFRLVLLSELLENIRNLRGIIFDKELLG